jgi:hypothetical protein
MMPACVRGADRRRKQQGHSPGLALVPSGYQAFRVLKHPGIGRASGGDLSVSLGLPLSSHLAAVEVHGRMVAQRACVFNVLRAALARPATREWAGAVAQSGKIL